MLCLSVELASKMPVGLGVEVDVEGERFVGWGYIPGHWSCLSISSALPVILSIMVLVSYNWKEPDVIICCQIINDRQIF